MQRFWSKVKKSSGCWEWLGARLTRGYGRFRFKGREWRAHRVAWVLTFGRIPKGKIVCHKCDVKECVRPSHLFLATQAENVADAKRKGRIAHGARVANAKLTDKKVLKIRQAAAAGVTLCAQAAKFGVSHVAISQVVTGKSWQHVKNTAKEVAA